MKAKPSRAIRSAVCKSTDGNVSLATCIDLIAAVSPELNEAVEGIWCGRNGNVRIELPAWGLYLILGWHEGRAEYAYIS